MIIRGRSSHVYFVDVLANERGDLSFGAVSVGGCEPIAPHLQENLSVIIPVILQHGPAKNASWQDLTVGPVLTCFLMETTVEHIGVCQMFPCVPGKVVGSMNFWVSQGA